ncbi:MAG: hypothetical protein KDE19_01675 [Caldilineaceae bacterium]|nr:hypothetical protein [Caldilineaceae bacterium]
MRSSIRTHLVTYIKHLQADWSRSQPLSHWMLDAQRFARMLRLSSNGANGEVAALSFPPHPLYLYRELLESLQANNSCVFRNLSDHVQQILPDPQRINIVLRHDVDAGEPAVVRALCEIEESLGLRSAVHILVDGELYDPMPLVSLACQLHDTGFDVGLHTQAWMKEAYAAAFDQELRQFESIFGFAPKTFTLHGAWPRTAQDQARRRQFTQELSRLIAEKSLLGYNNRFDWVSEDSNIQGQPTPISARFFQIAEGCYLGGVALLLTHDNHWQAA